MAEMTAHSAGTMFELVKQARDHIAAEEEVLILESMAMEIPVESPIAGVLAQLLVAEGQVATAGVLLVIVELWP